MSQRVNKQAIMIVALLTIFPMACGGQSSQPTPAPTPAPITVVDGDAGKRFELKVGQILEIDLKSNASTGYRWDASKSDDKVLRLEGEPEYKQDQQMPGAPGRQVFRFKVVGPGETNLTLVYHRPWETDQPAVNTFTVTVSAK